MLERQVRPGVALAAGLLTASLLASCAPTRLAETPAYKPPLRQPQAPSPPSRAVSSLANLPGWGEEDHAAALLAFEGGCGAAQEPAMQAVCAEARRLGPVDDARARAFLESHFRPLILSGPGLLTGYFSPEYPARAAPDDVFSAAVRGRPDDLVYTPAAATDAAGHRPQALQRGEDGRTWPYPDRAGIELTPATDALAYVRPEDLFFLQIQGSGVLVFPDGRRLKAAYAADNGRPFVPIASAMIRRHLLEPDHASATAIRAWLRAHAGPEAQTVMDLNPRYVFFALAPDDGRDSPGAAGTPLTAGRAIAVDPSWHSYGEPFWIDAAAPTLAGAVKTYRRLVMALDTGSAIKGNVRADLYLGRGDSAGVEAGRIRHTLLLIKLEPIPEPSSRAEGGAHEAIAAARGN